MFDELNNLLQKYPNLKVALFYLHLDGEFEAMLEK